MINIQKFMSDYSEMMKNPKQYVIKNMGVSEEIADDPNKIIQSLMNNGKITQAQYDSARNTAMQIQNNPMFRQMMNR
jgi:membrane peptidoglycan carboxypeptidase